MYTTTYDRSQPDPTPARPGRPGLAGFVRRRPLTAFLVWFSTVGQALVFAPIVARGYGVDLPAQVFVVASTLTGLLLPAVVITRIVDGAAGVRQLWRRAVDVWVSARWYALVLAGMPALATGLALAFFGAPTAALTTGALVSALVAGLLVQTVVSLVPNNWAEEVAWMGFVQARLQTRTTPMRAAALTAPLFALQHVALVVGSPLPMAVALMAFLIVVNIPIRALMGFAYNRTGSLFLVGLLHAAGNGVAAGSGFGAGFLAQLYPDQPFASLMHLLALAMIGLVAIAVTRARLGASGHRPTPATVPMPASAA
ncbi:CPBP family intramembrane glutamic endopeptidase [Geodermatophilus sabuli]|uniref:CAAX protease self-immunity n=1 Tax=Geodermatophilus sabuli TaxID=1564158 RepID=A0A285E9L5_9ACTN|nr:CPBP family intramembrane glutamic endopeptidase [Geodermatophilus sabuli]MBB3084774.1 membrane protease YdiL (CAAX protease family) [Geodermatophilus sabuli]SNX95818.1 CAAX protease self-immunity [Geodermatophilus sabuli]